MAGRLAATVYVANQVFGPDDDVPPDVAKLIDNPKAWAEQPDAEQPVGGDQEPYKGVTIPELKAEIDTRNEGRPEDAQIPATGNRADLVAALVADDSK